jgi:bacillithiol biosynthesis deacetylase BshB1
MKLDVLFFAAHPDDAELSCGGTLAKIVKYGKNAGIIDLTQGELGTRGSKDIRTKETKEASKVLGLSIRENLKIKDGDIENTSSNRLKIISVLRHYRPEIVFMPYHNDRHPDHINANKLIKEAVFYSGLSKISSKKNGVIQKPYRPRKSIFFMQTYTFEPSFIIDITNEFEQKMSSVKCYRSQFYNPGSKGPETFISSKNFMEYIEARARFYGFQIGVKYGEPFYTEENIKLNLQNLFEL